jgi:hypothetical protein
MRQVIPVSSYLKRRYIAIGYCYQCKSKLDTLPLNGVLNGVKVCHNCRIAPYVASEVKQ